MTRDELQALVTARRAEFYAGDPLYCAPLTQEQHPLMCDRCELPGAPWQWDGHSCACEGGPIDPVPAMDEYRTKFAPLFATPACEVCADSGLVSIAVGPTDRLSGQPDEIVEAACPSCRAGDLEAMHRIRRPWRGAPS